VDDLGREVPVLGRKVALEQIGRLDYVVVDTDDDHVLGPHGIQRTVEPRGGRMARDSSADERGEFPVEGAPTHIVARAGAAD
jgi:hypothetical protein